MEDLVLDCLENNLEVYDNEENLDCITDTVIGADVILKQIEDESVCV